MSTQSGCGDEMIIDIDGEVREEGGLMGGLNVITRTAGGSKGWREKEIGQIRMAEGMRRDRDWRT